MPTSASSSSSLATGHFFRTYTAKKCVLYLALLIASLTLMGYVAEVCSSDPTGGCATSRQSFGVAGGATSAIVVLALMSVSMIRRRLSVVVEIVMLCLLFVLWIAIAAVASSSKTAVGNTDTARVVSWVGFVLCGAILYYVLCHEGLPIRMKVVHKGKKHKKVRVSTDEEGGSEPSREAHSTPPEVQETTTTTTATTAAAVQDPGQVV